MGYGCLIIIAMYCLTSEADAVLKSSSRSFVVRGKCICLVGKNRFGKIGGWPGYYD